MMRSYYVCWLLTLLSWPVCAAPSTQSLLEEAQRYAADYPGLISLCDLTQRTGHPSRAPSYRAKGPPPVSLPNEPDIEASTLTPSRVTGKTLPRRTIAPTKVFDNLYYVGAGNVAAWVIQTSEGLILIDTLNNAAQAQQYIVKGLRTLGLDPADIKYIVITHEHGDHYGGQAFLTAQYQPTLLMSERGWQALQNGTVAVHSSRWGPAPTKVTTVAHRSRITLGEITVQFFATPGHTPGTLSVVFDVKDSENTHTAVLWGGTGLNFGPQGLQLQQYAHSALAMQQTVQQLNIEVFLSNHPGRDGTAQRIQQLAQRSPQAHPFVSNVSHVTSAFRLLEICALAQYQHIGLAEKP